MTSDPYQVQSAEDDGYVASGHVDLFRFIPLVALAMGVALIMAFLLQLCEGHLYFYVITPFVLALPVFGAIWAVVRLGHCRNVAIGAITALLLGAGYIGAYWQISYYRNVIVHGPFVVQIIELVGGAPGLPGYFVYRCKTTKPIVHPGAQPMGAMQADAGDAIFNYVLHGFEALIAIGLAVAVGRAASRRVYYERDHRWGSAFEFRLPPSALHAALQAISARDWAALAALPRASSTLNANAQSVLFRVEYLADAPDEVGYVTLSTAHLGKKAMLGLFGEMVGAGKKPSDLRQRLISPEQMRSLARAFPDSPLGPRAPAGSTETSPASAGTSRYHGGILGVLQRIGVAPVKTVGEDFRNRAITASLDLLDEQAVAEPMQLDASWCLPVEDSSRRDLKRAGWWKNKMLLSCAVCLFAALGLAAWLENIRDANGQRPAIATALLYFAGISAGAFALMSLLMVFWGTSIQKRLLSRQLGRRPGSLLQVAEGLPSRLLRLENAQTYHIAKIIGEDLCVCVFDGPNQRVLLEGITHRYVIRGEDVTNVWPLQSAAVVSLQISFRVGQETLAIVLSKENPLLFIMHGVFAGQAVKSLVRAFVDSFGREFPDAEGPAMRHAGS